MTRPFDVCIRGNGIVGQTLALLLARERLRVALVVPPGKTESPPDVRAFALNLHSRNLLESLRCWPREEQATPVLQMQVQGDRGGELNFKAEPQLSPALTWIVDVPALQDQLAAALRFAPPIELLTCPAPASLNVLCEGQSSSADFKTAFDRTPYPQQAIAARLHCQHAHGQIARQWFNQGEVLAFLPLDGPRQVAIVWSVGADRAAQLLSTGAEDFCHELEAASQQSLGQLSLASERQAWPLQKACAKRWSGTEQGESWVLAGDAAHKLHPLAGQGLNLGLADAAELAQLIGQRDYWRSVNDEKLLRRYERSRKTKVMAMQAVTDGMQLLFSKQGGGWQSMRNWGMNRLEQIPTLKQSMVKQALGL